MAKLTIGQKAERLLERLMGLRNPRLAEAAGSGSRRSPTTACLRARL